MTDFQKQTWDDESPMQFHATQDETKPDHPFMSTFDAMMAWEDGNISEDEAIHLFQTLVDNGMAWKLQGMYGRQAMAMINAGLITAKRIPAITRPVVKSAVMGDFD